MIDLEVKKPGRLVHPFRRYSHSGHSNIHVDTLTNGEVSERFGFAMEVGKAQGIIDALKELPCTACFIVNVTDNEWSANGTITVWNGEHERLVNKALADLYITLDRIAKICGRSSFSLSYNLRRDITHVEAD